MIHNWANCNFQLMFDWQSIVGMKNWSTSCRCIMTQSNSYYSIWEVQSKVIENFWPSMLFPQCSRTFELKFHKFIVIGNFSLNLIVIIRETGKWKVCESVLRIDNEVTLTKSESIEWDQLWKESTIKPEVVAISVNTFNYLLN